MSYAAYDLRLGVLELFSDAVRLSPYRADFGELPARYGRPYREQRPPQSREERREKRRAYDKRRREAEYEARRKQREQAPLVFWAGPPPDPLLWERFYVCMRCKSRSPTHRCTG